MPIRIISPGELFVAADPSLVLETSLGSCVGVALHDPAALVGGMIHVLLPSGMKEKEQEMPSRFASTGIPLLLQEMEKMGASKTRIVSHIAGGALIMVDRALSIEMNIGGRNSEMAVKILEENGVPILQQEVGGHVGRVFSFEIASGVTHVRKIGETRQVTVLPESKGELTNDDIKRKIRSLKPLPHIVRKILTALSSSKLNVFEVEQEIIKDQALTANVLKVCNSAYYGFPQQIRSVRRAFDLLGAKTIRDIVLATFCRDLYSRHMPGYSILKGELMKHAISCGLVAELIANEKKIGDSDVAFTAGLLHDIGKVILDQYASDKFSRILEMVHKEQMTFLEAESEVIRFNHAQVGGMVAREWNLPEVLVEAIMFHHHPEASKGDQRMVSAVHLANGISSMFGATRSVDALSNRIQQFAIATLALRKSEVERIVERLPDITRHLDMI